MKLLLESGELYILISNKLQTNSRKVKWEYMGNSDNKRPKRIIGVVILYL